MKKQKLLKFKIVTFFSTEWDLFRISVQFLTSFTQIPLFAPPDFILHHLYYCKIDQI